MDKWRGRYLMTSGVFLQIFGAVAFTLAEPSDGMSVVFAIPLAVGGLLLFGRGVRDTAQQTEPAPVPTASRPRLEELLVALQEDVNQLREDREFYRELYVDGGAPDSAPAGERALGVSRELTYRLVPESTGPRRPPATGPR